MKTFVCFGDESLKQVLISQVIGISETRDIFKSNIKGHILQVVSRTNQNQPNFM